MQHTQFVLSCDGMMEKNVAAGQVWSLSCDKERRWYKLLAPNGPNTVYYGLSVVQSDCCWDYQHFDLILLLEHYSSEPGFISVLQI